MSSLKTFFTVKSIRRQYMLLVLSLVVVVSLYAWFAGVWVTEQGREGIERIEKRLITSALNHNLRRHVVNADDALDLFLLVPTDRARNTFNSEIELARADIDKLLELESGHDLPIIMAIEKIRPLLDKLESAAREVMQVRITANNMYPAMRVANGEMLVANRTMLSELNTAIFLYEKKNLRKLNKYERKIYRLLVDTRDKWRTMIASYRLYLINRMGSLYEDVLQAQVDDVHLMYSLIDKNLKELKIYNEKYDLDLELSVAIDDFHVLAPTWLESFEGVVSINSDEDWRGDIALVTKVIKPILSDLYERFDSLDSDLKNISDTQVVEQANIARIIIKSIWGVALFVVFIGIIGFLIIEINFIRPIAKVAKSLNAEAHGISNSELPNVDVVEIKELTNAFKELKQQVHSRQLALEHIAMHDALTSLPNRALLMDRLNQSIKNCQRKKRSLALLMLDLDHFKEINDTLGHQTGDALLQQVGERLRNVLRDSDTVARLGGDEFAVLLQNVSETNAMRIATSINEAIEKVYDVYEHSLYVGVSIGVALFPEHGETAESLLQYSDVAMYVAKRSNASICVYDAHADEHSESQLSILSDLRAVVENEELFLQYQPKISMQDNSIIGVEALLRWNHPVHGVIYPDDFINVAEQTGLIKRISDWVLDTAIRDCQKLHEKGFKISVSVNLSVWDIQDIKIADNITSKLEKWGLEAKYLMIEITERVMMAEPERARGILETLDNMGIHVLIDDFGTGFSSLLYLKQLPVKMLKVDKSFVIDIMRDESDAAIVHSTIELAHNLGLQVIAEGVENDQTWSWLKKWGCDYAQGYYISHPLSFNDFVNYARTYSTENIIG